MCCINGMYRYIHLKRWELVFRNLAIYLSLQGTVATVAERFKICKLTALVCRTHDLENLVLTGRMERKRDSGIQNGSNTRWPTANVIPPGIIIKLKSMA